MVWPWISNMSIRMTKPPTQYGGISFHLFPSSIIGPDDFPEELLAQKALQHLVQPRKAHFPLTLPQTPYTCWSQIHPCLNRENTQELAVPRHHCHSWCAQNDIAPQVVQRCIHYQHVHAITVTTTQATPCNLAMKLQTKLKGPQLCCTAGNSDSKVHQAVLIC